MHPQEMKFQDKKYLAWVAKRRCLVCPRPSGPPHHFWNTGGKAKHNDYLAVPLCPDHHMYGAYAIHRKGSETFQKNHNIDIKDEIINLLSEYIQEQLCHD